MNNEQFRKLMLANSAKSSSLKDDSPSTRQPVQGSSLGSRSKASIPMTPRSVGGQSSFARQLAEQRQGEHASKKFKTSAPKGVKLASGYVDRAKTREEEDDDRAARLKALEQSLKDEEIDQATFDRLRYEIAGGDLESTHLVKGLDFKLLERVRKGEDVYSGKKDDEQPPRDEELDIDDAFDQLEDKEVQAIEKEKAEKKKGQLSTVALVPGKKRTRDQIIAEMKAARQAAKAKAEPALGDRFRKIGGKQMPGSRIERDSKGREVLIIVDEDGHEKRKVRKIQPGAAPKEEDLAPDPTLKPLGMEVPEQYRNKEEEEEDGGDVDIFDDVGDDYDPLAGMNDSDDDSDDEDKSKETDTKTPADTSMPPPPKPQPAAKQNYFQNSKTGLISEETSKAPSMSDPAIMAAIKRAFALRPIGGDRDEADSGDEADEEAKKAKANEERRKRLLENNDRDAEDMDMGFGTSRFEDEEDFDDQKVKLSRWGGGDDDDGGDGSGKTKRKRGPKKRKGDVNSAADVLRVMEQRKNK